MTTPLLRRAARVIVLDEDDRVLLLRIDDHGRIFWATPGGALEDGESGEDAARREVTEELGLTDLTLSPPIAQRSKDHLVGKGTVRRQVETYYIARVPALAVVAAHGTQTDNIEQQSWWRLEEITNSKEPVYPAGLAALINRFLTYGPTKEPVLLDA